MKLAFKEDYLQWQSRLKFSNRFRNWWRFWSNYSWLFLLPIIFYLSYIVTDAKVITRIAVAFIIARLILVPILSRIFPKARPYQEFNFNPLSSIFLSLETKAHNSFPSSHMISLTAASGALVTSYPVFALIFMVVAILTGLGRVVLGFHYPKDIIFSLISGLIIGIIVSLLI